MQKIALPRDEEHRFINVGQEIVRVGRKKEAPLQCAAMDIFNPMQHTM